MDKVIDFTEKLVKGLVNNVDILKVEDFTDEDGSHILEIIVHNDDIKSVIGKAGVNAKAIRTLVQACAYKQGIGRVKINIDSI